MKHVNDEFWQQFGPQVLAYARQHGKRQFFMFGEVFDTTKSFTSHFPTHDRVQAVLDFPFQQAAQNFAPTRIPTDELRDFFAGDDWYTDADSNAYQLPTFLGNHDMGGSAASSRSPTPTPTTPRRWPGPAGPRLMYFSRGNPVVYYGDEQGFTGDGGDQDARQDMFPSQVASYNDDDLIGTDATTADDNFDRRPPAVPVDRRGWPPSPAATGRCATAPSSTAGPPPRPASTPSPGLDRHEQHEYVVAVNNAEQADTAAVPT
jgi:glycosidase